MTVYFFKNDDNSLRWGSTDEKPNMPSRLEINGANHMLTGRPSLILKFSLVDPARPRPKSSCGVRGRIILLFDLMPGKRKQFSTQLKESLETFAGDGSRRVATARPLAHGPACSVGTGLTILQTLKCNISHMQHCFSISFSPLSSI